MRRISPYFVTGLIVAIPVAWAPAQAISVSPQSAATQPAVDDSAGALLSKLRAIPAKNRTREERALIAGLEFCDAVRRADGAAAHKLLDAIGYQPLPLEGDLPEQPGKPTMPSALSGFIDSRPQSRPERIPAAYFELRERESLRRSFPAVARWMLPRDFALVIEQPDGSATNWVTRGCCLVIRIRGQEASIIGGNLFDALETRIEENGDRPPARGAVDGPPTTLVRRNTPGNWPSLPISPIRRRITA